MSAVLLALLAAAPCARQKNPLLAAKCEQKQGHFVEALERLSKLKTKKAQALRAALQAQITTYHLFTEPEDAAVTVDGAAPSRPLVLNPGHHLFHAEKEGFHPVDRDELAVCGTHPTLTLVLEALPPEPAEAEEQTAPAPVAQPMPAAPSAAVVAPEPRAEKPAPKQHSVVPYLLGGAGLVTVLTGGTFWLTSELQHVEGGRRLAAYTLVGIGGALCVAAIVWLLVERRPGADLR
jgi:hypothetical protein